MSLQTPQSTLLTNAPPQNAQMSSQKYKRTNFEEEENSAVETAPRPEMPSPTATFHPTVSFQRNKVTCWRRTLLEKILLLLLILLIFIIFILALFLAHKKQDPSHKDTTCLKNSCVNTASSILSSIDQSVDPCHDFYHFSCGNWIKSASIPAGSRSWDKFQEVRLQNLISLKEAVESPMSESLNNVENQIKVFYKTCLDEDKHKEQLDISPILPLVEIVKGWSISEIGGVSYDASEPWDLFDLYLRSRKVDFNFFFRVEVSENAHNPNTNMIKLAQCVILEKELFGNKTEKNTKKIQAYKDYMLETAVLFGADKDNSSGPMEELFEFMTQIAKISYSLEEKREDSMNPKIVNISKLQQSYPFINWLEYLNLIFKPFNITLNSSEPIDISNGRFFEKLSPLIIETIKTEKGRRTVQNYLMWDVLSSYSPLLSKKFREPRSKLSKKVWGIVGEEEEWKKCLSMTEDMIGFGVGSMFVRKKFEAESKISATKMIKNIKAAFISNIPNLTWMDDSTRQASIEKANAMKYQIGYPEFILNNTMIEAYFREFDIRENEFFNNIYRLSHTMANGIFSKLRAPNDNLHWAMSPSTVNAYYSPTKNLMVFPAGILQGQFFNKDLPPSINYGSIGWVVGHELTHGFDDQGSNYDLTGVYRKWWDDEIRTKFHNRTQCLVEQYNKYQVNGLHLNGKVALGENIADNGGLKSAYKAFIALGQSEQKLPGVHFNAKQLFFISSAQSWCSHHTKEDLEGKVDNDVHSISQFRVIGTVSNFDEFSKAFDCPLGAAMNPRDKCEVW